MADGPLGEPIVIRFDGLDADEHGLELSTLAEALGGLSRIIAVSTHFALTQELALQKNLWNVRIVARAPQEGCFIIEAWAYYSHHHPLIKTITAETAGILTAGVITYIFTRAAHKKEEMKHLSGALEKAISELGTRDQPTIDRLLATVDKMADKLVPAVKHAIAPVGESARSLTVGMASIEQKVVVDEAEKMAILSPAGLTVSDEETYRVLISELDMVTGACHVAIEGDEARRFPARITDPVVGLEMNAYGVAMISKSIISVRAKATIRDGEIERLFISDYEGKPRGEEEFALA